MFRAFYIYVCLSVRKGKCVWQILQCTVRAMSLLLWQWRADTNEKDSFFPPLSNTFILPSPTVSVSAPYSLSVWFSVCVSQHSSHCLLPLPLSSLFFISFSSSVFISSLTLWILVSEQQRTKRREPQVLRGRSRDLLVQRNGDRGRG